MSKNAEDRKWMIEYWARYVREHDDRDWSRQQRELIDSVL